MSARPIVKWAGGKTKLLPDLTPRLPAFTGRYFEPFAGGAALFFALDPQRAVLGDANRDLIAMYRTLACDVERVLEALEARTASHAIDPSGYYYETRALWNLGRQNVGQSAVSRASAFLYLGRACFNGLWRVNRKGEFNVSWNKEPTVSFDVANIRAAAEVLRRAELRPGDYRDCVHDARAGDLVYMDPPYVPVAKTANYTAYTADGFGPEHQRDLADLARSLVERGVHVVLSNSDTPMVRELYQWARIETVMCPRAINSNGAKRGKVPEVIVIGDASAVIARAA